MGKIKLISLKNLWVPAVLILPLVILLPGIEGFAYPPQNPAYSDITVSHYPNALFLRDTILNQHTIPLWSPTILSGYPFAANPLSGLWYPFGWLAIILPLPLGFNLLVLLHLYLGGIGMWLYLKREGLGDPAALLGGVAFEAMPKLFAHFGAGHITLLYAIAWTPWLLLSSIGKDEGNSTAPIHGHKKWIPPFLPGVVYALIVLADVRWAAYAGILWWGYTLARSYWISSFNGMKRAVANLFLQTILGLLLAAPLLVPLGEYTRLSTRAGLSSKDVLTFSLPPARLLGLVFPTFRGFHEWVLYPGIIILVLALAGLAWPQKRPATKFWLGVSLVTLVFSLGAYLPPVSIILSAPGFDLLRVPSRMLFITGIGLAVAAAGNVDQLLKGWGKAKQHRTGLVSVSMGGFVVFFCVGIRLVTGSLPVSFAWGAGGALAAVMWIGLYLNGWLKQAVWVSGLLAITMLDLGVVDSTLFVVRSQESVFDESGAERRYLAEQHGEFRVYSPSYSLPQQVAARWGLQMASGIDPLQLKSYVNYMVKASGVPQNGYSVALPPLDGENPHTVNIKYLPDPRLLGFLNVRYILSGYPLDVNGLTLVKQYPSTYLYQNTRVQPRAWVLPAGSSVEAGIIPVNNYNWLPNQISMSAEGPGLLVLSEVFYPGWRVSVDGMPAAIQDEMGILRSVSLPPGDHQIVFAYRPTSVYIGLGLCLLGIVGLAAAHWIQHR